MKLSARAPGKVNLCLFLGPVRSDGRHELVTLFESVSLADEVTMAVANREEVVCPGVPGPNIVEQALIGLRRRGWAAPPVLVTIEKRIPVAGGMGGGSADAAAVLRLAPRLGAVPADAVAELAAELGSDVPSQLVPGVSIGKGAGDVVERIEQLGPHAFVIVPQSYELSTADVYREADRLELPRTAAALSGRHRLLLESIRAQAWLVGNDLEPAALSLRPDIRGVLDAVRNSGADRAIVSGSGPTVLGLIEGPDAPARAEAVALGLADRYPGATPATPVSEEFWAPRGTRLPAQFPPGS